MRVSGKIHFFYSFPEEVPAAGGRGKDIVLVIVRRNEPAHTNKTVSVGILQDEGDAAARGCSFPLPPNDRTTLLTPKGVPGYRVEAL